MAGGGSTWRAYALSLLAPALVVGGWWWMRARAPAAAGLAAVTRAVPVEEGEPLEFAGCREVRTGPICTYRPDDEITLWVDVEAPADVQIRVDGATRAVDWTSVQGGLQGRVPLSLGAAELRVDRRDDDKTRRSRLALALAPDLSLVDQAKTLRGEGKFDEALERIRPWLDDEDPYRRVAARALEARIIRQKGDPEEGIRRLRRLIEVDRELGLVSWETLDRNGLAFMIHAHTGRADHAFDVLAPVDELVAQHPEGAARLPYYQGHFAAESGDVARALRDLRAAVRRSERLGMQLVHMSALTQTVRLLHRIGRYDESAAHLAELAQLSGPASPCARARFNNNLADALLEIRRARPDLSSALPAPGPLVERALELTAGECPNGRDLAFALHTSAQHAAGAGDVAAATESLERLRAAVEAPDLNLYTDVLSLEARLFAAAARPEEGLKRYQELLETAAMAGRRFVVWDAWVGQALQLNALGKPESALEAFEQAEAVLDGALRLIPLGEGRGGFAASRQRGMAQHIELLLSLGRIREAISTARRSLRRPYRLLDLARTTARLTGENRDRWNAALERYRSARQRLDESLRVEWQSSASRASIKQTSVALARRQALARLNQALEQLPRSQAALAEETEPVPDNVVLLVVFPSSTGWFVFSLTSDSADFARLSDLTANSPLERATRIVNATVEQIRRRDEVIVVAHPGLGETDLAQALVDGEPLIAARRISYSLDLPDRPSRTGHSGSRAVIVRGEVKGYAAAEPEVEWVGRWLETRGLRPQVLRPAPNSSMGALRSALERQGTTWLHYVGHAEARGIDGWESALMLGEGVRMTATDVLALDRVPPHVVLSGCETARTSGALRSPGLGLAQSFLLSGASEVVATSRRIEDRDALGFMRLLYAGQANVVELAEIFHAAQKSAMLRGETSDWAAFRLVTRSWRPPES